MGGRKRFIKGRHYKEVYTWDVIPEIPQWEGQPCKKIKIKIQLFVALLEDCMW